MSKEIKQIRGQIRQVVRDILPEVLNSEMGDSLRKDLFKRLDDAVRQIQEVLKQVDQRSKDVQGYMIRQTLKPASVGVVEGSTKNEPEKA
jgi:hypothetical protein